ncbi:MAG: hypothetical protein KF727_14170 [Microbacteriaceae bacterium]|nr:hypothetical protein [Microbacteriaceae bacterium]
MSDQGDSGTRGNRRGLIAAAIVVGTILVAGVIVLTSAILAPVDQPTPENPDDGTPPVAASDRSVCGLPGFEDESTLDSAPDNEWELVGTVAAPTDPDVGPGVVDDGLRSCFAHTAEGALYAAVNYMAVFTDAELRGRRAELLAPGPGREVVAASDPGVPSANRVQVSGFAITDYSAASATVDLAVTYSTGEMASLPVRLSWADGDWKVVVTDDGGLPLSPAAITSLGGYTPWAGA